MRKTGSNCEFKKERDRAVMDTFRSLVSQCGCINMPRLMQLVASQPCARFWVSEERATIVIADMMRGIEATRGMGSGKRRMFAEIHRRVSALRAKDTVSPLVRLVREVIDSPAPEFYMSPGTVRNILSVNRGGWCNG